MKIFACILTILLSSLFGYLVGGIPNAVIIGKVFFKRDPRLEGSKNSGGTNAGRIFGVKIGILVITLDIIKVVVPFFVTYLLFTNLDFFKNILFYSDDINAFGRGNTISQLAYWITPFFGIIGHCFSPYINLKGGKAVSSFVGFAISSSWLGVLLIPLTFFSTIKINKKVSFASILSSLILVVVSWIIYTIYLIYGLKVANYLMYFGFGPEICIYFPIFTTISLIIIVVRHRANIKRLIKGEEPNAYWLKD